MEQLESKLQVRLAGADDAPTVLDLWQMSAKWLNAKGIYQWRPDFFKLEQVHDFMNSGAEVYIAEIDEAAVGTYVLTWSDPTIWKELDNLESGYIHRFAVNRDDKGKGIGNLILKAAEEHIRLKGKRLIRLDCMADNARLNQYYKDCGFHFVRRIDEGGWSAHLYEKE